MLTLLTNRIVSTIGTTVAIQAIGIVSGVLLARYLGVQGRGELATVILWPTIVVYLGDLGGPNTYAYQTSQSPDRVESLIANAGPIVAIQSCILVILGLPMILWATSDLPQITLVSVIFLVSYIPINLSTRYFHSINQGMGFFGYFNAVRFGVQAATATGMVIVFSLGFVSVTAVVFVTLIANSLALLVALSGVKRVAKGYWRPNWVLASETFTDGVKAHIGNVTPIDTLRFDLAFVSGLLSAHEVGIYVVATAVANIPRSIAGSLGMVAMPMVGGAATTTQRAEITSVMMKISMLLLFSMSAVLLVAVEWAIPFVYGSDFSTAITSTRVLLIGVTFGGMRQVLNSCLRGAGSPVVGSIAEVVNWMSLGLGVITFVPLFGLTGVSTAVSLAYLISFIIVLGQSNRVLKTRLMDMLPKPAELMHGRAWIKYILAVKAS